MKQTQTDIAFEYLSRLDTNIMPTCRYISDATTLTPGQSRCARKNLLQSKRLIVNTDDNTFVVRKVAPKIIQMEDDTSCPVYLMIRDIAYSGFNVAMGAV